MENEIDAIDQNDTVTQRCISCKKSASLATRVLRQSTDTLKLLLINARCTNADAAA
jgi:hypothetical protein